MSTPIQRPLAQMAQAAYEMPLLAVAQPSDPSGTPFPHLILLVFEAVLEVVCVSLPGYIVARLGHFDAEKQKFLANLNVMLFTPCLIFTKLASQLSPTKFADLAIIPAIFIVQTAISWLVAQAVNKFFGFNRRASNFVTAMGVFGNSNSLPISLVLSLSQTLKGLHWHRLPDDNDDDVAARGILYLLIFQQLGQLVRWSWGYHVLLAPKEKYPEYQDEAVEAGRYRDEPDADEPRRDGLESEQSDDSDADDLIPGLVADSHSHLDRSPTSEDFDRYEPAGRTPVTAASRASPNFSDDDDDEIAARKRKLARRSISDLQGRNNPESILSFPRIGRRNSIKKEESGVRAWLRRLQESLEGVGTRAVEALPGWAKTAVRGVNKMACKVYRFLSDFMNPPLWAMLSAIVVASVPALKELFFEEDSFVNNSVTSALRSNGGVAVPLILVVLGANLARNTQKRAGHDPEEAEIGTKLLIASLVSRMLLPTLIMSPILLVAAKYLNISILDDPIFIVVCFLLSGAPSALQLAQICQINGVYETVMSKILFQSYVIWILPSTLGLVVAALKVLEQSK